jgi:aspartyl-tRNA(Asn)/glutamyl-tRNA(Gln) amidotransferase subunit B
MSREFETVIGLEVHVELKTRSKIFCSCSNQFGAAPNTNVCPICAGFPGMLPVLNEQVVEYAIKSGLALNCEIADYCKFDRKNYFYPDLPKAYQISQYDLPICKKGFLDIEIDGKRRRIGINRAHLEEDAGKLVHQGTISSTPFSLVDLNRSGVPLLEIVSEPDMRSPQEAREYMEKLRSLLLFAGVSDCKMEEGSLRCDANVSVRPYGQKEFGTRTEIKNLNSFKSLEKAIEYEVRRQIEAIEDGEEIVQETRTWEEDRQITRAMRSKEEAHDYRYFPDPDLPPLRISREWVEQIRDSMPEMPDAARDRLKRDYGLSDYDTKLLTMTPDYLNFFDECSKYYQNGKNIANWIMGEYNKLLKAHSLEIPESKIKPPMLADMLKLVDNGKISGKMAKEVFATMFETGKTAEQIVEEKGLAQISDEGALRAIIKEVIKNNPSAVEDYRNGKKKATGFLMGQVMQQTKGQANPALVNQILIEELNA